MILIYFDESKDDAEHPHYHLGAVGVSEENLNTVEARIAQIAQDAFGSEALTKDTELHAVDIYHRKRHFKDWTDFEARVDLLRRLVAVLSMPEVFRIDIQINCDGLYGGHAPSDIAFMFFCERADRLAKDKKTIGMLIGDRESDQFAERYATALSDYRVDGTDFAFGRDITNLVDSVHFTHSHLSRFLQLADAYTWLLQFRRRNQGSDNLRHQGVLDLLREEGVNLFPTKYKSWPA
jgi:hypothetical protein